MNLLKRAELIKENELLKNNIEQYKKDNELLKKELQKIKRCLSQYKKENEQLQQNYDIAFNQLIENTKRADKAKEIAKREIEEQLAKYKKLGRKQYKEESTIKLMYDLYINENKSFKQIVDHLNEEGIKTKLNRDWVKSSISCIMKNEKNIKKYLDEEQYRKFTELLESNKRNIKKK